MTDVWSRLASAHGAAACVAVGLTPSQIAALTADQARVIFPLVRRHMIGHERRAVDFGCGAGRFSGHLADGTGCSVVAYDPCVEFLAEAPDHPYVVYAADDRAYLLAQPFDIVFVAMVLGSPEGSQETTMARLADLLAPRGLLVLLDHMPDEPPKGRWWSFLPVRHYTSLCSRHGIALQKVGEVDQAGNRVAICVGRRK